MTTTVRGWSSGLLASAGTSWTVPLPTGTLAGDTAIVFVGCGSNTISVAGSGSFTMSPASSSASPAFRVGWHIVTPADVTAGLFTVTVGSTTGVAFCVTLYNGDGINLWNPVSPPSITVNLTSTTLTVATITTTTGGCLVFWVGVARGAATVGTPKTISAPATIAGNTPTASGLGQVNSNTNTVQANVGMAAWYTTQAAAGSVGTVNGSLSATTPSAGVCCAVVPGGVDPVGVV